MPIELQHWPAQALDIAAELRRQLDDATAKRADLEATIAQLRADLQGKAEELSEGPDAQEREAQGSRFWFAAWTNANRRNAALNLRIVTLEGWLKDSGTEATQLQAALALAQEANDEMTRRVAETEGDFAEAVADRAEALGKLARCECGGHEVH